MEAEPFGAADTGIPKERRQVRLHADRAHARAATTVRDAEGFVEIQVRNVAAVIAGPCEPNLRVQIRAVDIDLASVAMHSRA